MEIVDMVVGMGMEGGGRREGREWWECIQSDRGVAVARGGRGRLV